jgi:hypothetical protein
MGKRLALVPVVLLVLLGGCGGGSDPAPPTMPDPPITQAPAPLPSPSPSPVATPPPPAPPPTQPPAPQATCDGASVPASAACGRPTARCNNAQWSCSQNRSGTCSSNGGVRCWVCPGPLC